MAKKKIKELIVQVKCGYFLYIGKDQWPCGKVVTITPDQLKGQENKVTIIKEVK